MKFLVFRSGSGTAVAALKGAVPAGGGLAGVRAVNVSQAMPEIGSDLQILAQSEPQRLTEIGALIDAGEATLDAGELRPALPIARPGKVICLGLNYAGHAKEGGHEVPTYPGLFMRATTSLIAAGEPMVRPRVSDKFDFEAELMLIIGKGGRQIGEAAALDHVFGYTIFNDGSVRDFQRKSSQWTPGKNFDGTGPVGPVVVTPDEVPPGAAGLRILSRLDGEIMQDSNTSDMIFPVARTIAIVSEFATLEPGDMIAFGTPQGVGYARTPPVFMKPGQTIEIEIEGIGVLANPVVGEERLVAAGSAA
jgi:2-keto-4-pentenoate hydratase/2-oxohepta-3-ene-1,7-dioic acid hydratase in catechol pathway